MTLALLCACGCAFFVVAGPAHAFSSELSALGEKRISFRHVLGGLADMPGYDSRMEQTLAVHITGQAAPGLYTRFHYDERKEAPLQGTHLKWQGNNGFAVNAGEIPLDLGSGLFVERRDMLGISVTADHGWFLAGELGGSVHREMIIGNGEKGPYMLANQEIIYASEIVSVDGRLLRRNKDYTVDWVSGTLWFNLPLARGRRAEVAYDHRQPFNRRITGAGGVFGRGPVSLDYKFIRHEDDNVLALPGMQEEDHLVQALGLDFAMGFMDIRVEGARSVVESDETGDAFELLLDAGRFSGNMRYWDREFRRLDKSAESLRSEALAGWKGNKGNIAMRIREDIFEQKSALLSLGVADMVVTAELPPEEELLSRYSLDYNRRWRGQNTGVYSAGLTGIRSFFHDKADTSASGVFNFQNMVRSHMLTGGMAIGWNDNYCNLELRSEGRGLFDLPWIHEIRSTTGDVDSFELKSGFRTVVAGWNVSPYLMSRHETGFGDAIRAGMESRRTVSDMTFFMETWAQDGKGGIPDSEWISFGTRGNSPLARLNARISRQYTREEPVEWRSRFSIDSRKLASGRLRFQTSHAWGSSISSDRSLFYDRKTGDGIVVSVGARQELIGDQSLAKMEFTMLANL